MQTKNYYQILGVSPSATSSEIKAAYRKLAHIYHPDKNTDDALAAQAFREMNEAYSVLSDKEKRTAYHHNQFGNFIARQENSRTDISTEFIYEKITTIRKNLANADPYRMNKEALLHELEQLFSAYHLAVLKRENNLRLNDSIVDETLAVISFLPIEQQKNISAWFKNIPQNREEKINHFLQMQQSIFFWEKYKFLFVLIATIVICLVVYCVIR